jgi:hypothetical protein
MTKPKRPLNRRAVARADDEFYRYHPEFVRDGKRVPLDPNDPAQDELVLEWLLAYRAYGGRFEDDTPPAAGQFSQSPLGATAQLCPLADEGRRKSRAVRWSVDAVWCSETAVLDGATRNYAVGEQVAFSVLRKRDGKTLASGSAAADTERFTVSWLANDVLSEKVGDHFETPADIDAEADGARTSRPLHLRFLPTLPLTPYAVERSHFSLSAADFEIEIVGDLDFMQGWAAEVVKLESLVESTVGGLLDDEFSWTGYRWMKRVAGVRKYWDGTDWQDLPSELDLSLPESDSLYFSVGFYRNGDKFTCQYGGDWPETFSEWSIADEGPQKRLDEWKATIETTWTGKFRIKRAECTSTRQECCRYSTRATADFTEKTDFTDGLLIIANGNIRANDSLWFIDDSDLAAAAHEFGHHLGNPDEYEGAVIDETLDTDGAVDGIDRDSIMGQDMTKVKARHFGTILRHFAAMVKTASGKDWTYEAIAVP